MTHGKSFQKQSKTFKVNYFAGLKELFGASTNDKASMDAIPGHSQESPKAAQEEQQSRIELGSPPIDENGEASPYSGDPA